jgi:hypothetical protein
MEWLISFAVIGVVASFAAVDSDMLFYLDFPSCPLWLAVVSFCG